MTLLKKKEIHYKLEISNVKLTYFVHNMVVDKYFSIEYKQFMVTNYYFNFILKHNATFTKYNIVFIICNKNSLMILDNTHQHNIKYKK